MTAPLPQVHVSADVGSAAGELVAQALAAAVSARGHARLAIPGGRSPGPVFRWLRENLPPDVARALTVTWVDERHATDDTNYATAWAEWLEAADPRPRVVSWVHPGTLEEAVAEALRRWGEEVGSLDVVLLGAGPDGHIASLFPGHPGLAVEAPVFGLSDSPKPPPERISLSMKALHTAPTAVLVASGADRAPALRDAYHGDASLPLGRFRPPTFHWVLDPPAAEALR